MNLKISFWNRLLQKIYFTVALIIAFFRDSFFWSLVIAYFAGMYVWLMIYVAMLLHVNPWMLILPPLAVLCIVWYWIVSERMKNYLDLLIRPYKPRDVEKTVKEYLEILRKRDAKKET